MKMFHLFSTKHFIKQITYVSQACRSYTLQHCFAAYSDFSGLFSMHLFRSHQLNSPWRAVKKVNKPHFVTQTYDAKNFEARAMFPHVEYAIRWENELSFGIPLKAIESNLNVTLVSKKALNTHDSQTNDKRYTASDSFVNASTVRVLR